MQPACRPHHRPPPRHAHLCQGWRPWSLKQGAWLRVCRHEAREVIDFLDGHILQRLASRKEQQRLQGWVREGLITATPENVIDYSLIRKHWQDVATQCRVQQIGFDPWNSTQFALELGEQDGLTMVRGTPGRSQPA